MKIQFMNIMIMSLPLFAVTILSPISTLGQNTTDNMILGNTTNATGVENATDVGKTSSLLGGGGGGGNDGGNCTEGGSNDGGGFGGGGSNDGDCQRGAIFNNG